MSDYEYEEQNLDDFLIKSSKILISEGNNEEKEIIIESLKQHLSSIFNNKFELQNFYKTLNMVIFNENSNKIKNRQCFKIYPIVFSFNPNSCLNYIDFYLLSLNRCIIEENKADFTYLGIIFSEIITMLFSKEKENKNLVSKSFSLRENDKYKLYDKLFKYLKEKIQSTDKINQSFGCLLLTELIEKCPFIKEQKYLEEIFKLLSEYLEDKKFQCKLDILNCLISLIFITEQGFKSYANICLFSVLDYLTDEQWIMRKLSVNIVYTLVFFCKEQILPVKDNVIEFLNILKEDPVEEIREVCQQILKLLEDENKVDNILKINGNNFKNSEDKIIDNFDDKFEDKYVNDIGNLNNKDMDEENKLNNVDIKKKNISHTDKKYKVKKNNGNNKMENYNKNKSDKTIIHNRNKNSNLINNSISNKNRSRRTPIKNKIKVVPKYNNKIKDKINNNKINIENSKKFDSLGNADTKNNSGNKKENLSKDENQKEIIENDINPENETEKKEIKESNEIVNEKESNENNNEENELKETEDEKFEKTLTNIMGQLGKIQEGQLQFLNMINDLQTKLNNNYDNLNERINILEKNYNENKISTTPNKKNNSHINNKKGKGKTQNFEELKNKFRLGKYNEALNDAIHNEKNLFKLLPMIDKNNINKINNDIMDDVINILNKKLILINIDNGRAVLSDILSFYLCLIKSKFPLKLISQLNIKDSLVMLQNKNNDKLLQIDINNIDAIVKSLKV